MWVLLAPALAAIAGPAGGPAPGPLPARPDTVDLYRWTRVGMLSPVARRALPRVYVPNTEDGTVSVIDPRTYRVIETLSTGRIPEHVVPGYDLRTLWVANDGDNSLTPIDPATGRIGPKLAVADPYNLYFTPDGRSAIVVAEGEHRLDFRDPRTMALRRSVAVPCRGVNHLDFTADGRRALVSCEFSGQVLALDLRARRVTASLRLAPPGGGRSMPQDVRAAPDGSVFYVADMLADGVFLVALDPLRQVGFVPTGTGAHGIVTGHGGRPFYVTNRGWHSVMGGRRGPGSVSVLDPATGTVLATWPVPGGGSPDMGNVSADGRELWVSGRYDDEVYVFDTATGALAHRIRVGRGPHGLAAWPEPGRLSLGHTGNMR